MALADLAMLRDDMYRYPMRLALGAAYPAHAYGRSATGTEASLAALTADDARAWHRDRVRAAPAVLALVGDVDPDEAAAALSREFAALRPRAAAHPAPPSWPAELRVAVETRAKAQTALALVFPGPSRRDPERVAARLLVGIASGLGGRFFDELRDKRSLAYTVQAFASARPLAGSLGAYIATGPSQEEEAREGLLGEFARLRQEPVTDEELQRAQVYAIGTHAIQQQSGSSVLGEMVDAWLLGEGLHELGEFDARVRAVTPADLLALSERWFVPSRRTEGIVRGTAVAAAPPAGTD
jgi:zinc protease